MSEISKELFLLDIESALREIGASDYFSSDHNHILSRSLEDLAGLLFSLGTDEYGTCALELLSKIGLGAEPGRSRRLLNEYCELVASKVSSIRSRDESTDLGGKLQSLRVRIGDLGLDAIDRTVEGDSTVPAHPTGMSDVYVDSSGSLGDLQDELHVSAIQEPILTSATKTLMVADNLVSKLVVSTKKEIDNTSDLIGSQGRAEPLVRPDDPEQGSAAPSPTNTVNIEAISGTTAGHYSQFGIAGTNSLQPLLKQRIADIRPRVDRAFMSAVSTLLGNKMHPFDSQLLQAIDGTEHQPLTLFLPDSIRLDYGQGVNIDSDIGTAFGNILREVVIEGAARAVNANHTLIFTVTYEHLGPISNLATIIATLGGRISVDRSTRSMQVSLPSSKRLLRFLPIGVGSNCMAISWAQYMPETQEEGRSERRVRLTIGEEPDSLAADLIGQDQIGVFYPIPPGLRRQERFRGLVLSADYRPLPVYG